MHSDILPWGWCTRLGFVKSGKGLSGGLASALFSSACQHAVSERRQLSKTQTSSPLLWQLRRLPASMQTETLAICWGQSCCHLSPWARRRLILVLLLLPLRLTKHMLSGATPEGYIACAAGAGTGRPLCRAARACPPGMQQLQPHLMLQLAHGLCC